MCDVFQIIQNLERLHQVLVGQRQPHLLQKDLQRSILESMPDHFRTIVNFVLEILHLKEKLIVVSSAQIRE